MRIDTSHRDWVRTRVRFGEVDTPGPLASSYYEEPVQIETPALVGDLATLAFQCREAWFVFGESAFSWRGRGMFRIVADALWAQYCQRCASISAIGYGLYLIPLRYRGLGLCVKVSASGGRASLYLDALEGE